MKIEAVFFDVGETLIDESREWNEWADDLGVSRFSFHALLGSLIESGQHHRRVFEIVKPGASFAELRRERESTGKRLCDYSGRFLSRRSVLPEKVARSWRSGRHCGQSTRRD